MVALYLASDATQDMSKKIKSLLGMQIRSIEGELKRHELEMRQVLRRLEQSELTKMDQLKYTGEIAREMASYDAKIAELKTELEQEKKRNHRPQAVA
jgi:hypothetical protein